MRAGRARRLWTRGALLAALVVLGACGDSTVHSQARAVPALAVSPLTNVTLSGDPGLAIPSKTDSGSGQQVPDVTLTVDDSGLLVIHVRVHSSGAERKNVALRATLLDAGAASLGEAGGGAINVDPGSTTDFELNGRQPPATIAAIRIAASSRRAPG